MSDSGLICCICSENLTLKCGRKPSTLPLRAETVNLAKLLRDIGIGLSVNISGSVCKPCARKVLNCYKVYIEIQKKVSEPNTPTSCKAVKRVTSARTPTGITPSSKRNCKQTSGQSKLHIPVSKKSLFPSCDPVHEQYDVVEDHIASLMNLPTEACSTQPPTVKIFVGYPVSMRVLERSYEAKYESDAVKSLCKENYPSTSCKREIPAFP